MDERGVPERLWQVIDWYIRLDHRIRRNRERARRLAPWKPVPQQGPCRIHPNWHRLGKGTINE